MHAGFGPVRISHTTGSMVSELIQEQPIHWVTATSTPCTSVFKPIWIDAGFETSEFLPKGQYDHQTLWWQHEKFQRLVSLDYNHRIHLFSEDRNKLEEGFISSARELTNADTSERRQFTENCFTQSEEHLQRWNVRVASEPVRQLNTLYYSYAWKAHNRRAQLPGL
jgi:dipeptidase